MTENIDIQTSATINKQIQINSIPVVNSPINLAPQMYV
jgi:hypothetical protein